MRYYTNDKVIEKLTSIKGIGEWTAHMFLMFQLGRKDVFPIGDSGIKNGMKIAYSFKDPPNRRLMEDTSLKWRPYRSIGSLYMWKVKDNVIVSKNE